MLLCACDRLAPRSRPLQKCPPKSDYASRLGLQSLIMMWRSPAWCWSQPSPRSLSKCILFLICLLFLVALKHRPIIATWNAMFFCGYPTEAAKYLLQIQGKMAEYDSKFSLLRHLFETEFWVPYFSASRYHNIRKLTYCLASPHSSFSFSLVFPLSCLKLLMRLNDILQWQNLTCKIQWANEWRIICHKKSPIYMLAILINYFSL